ncbi:hypothetical protein [Nocardioides convexus]|uniref:hypothetical protein n=1 Tax=Nocardioides convexus TaxID=2712224 RepID=UPI0024186E60|nr:hypothetical protein [Nocardioides convexus]
MRERPSGLRLLLESARPQRGPADRRRRARTAQPAASLPPAQRDRRAAGRLPRRPDGRRAWPCGSTRRTAAPPPCAPSSTGCGGCSARSLLASRPYRLTAPVAGDWLAVEAQAGGGRPPRRHEGVRRAGAPPVERARRRTAPRQAWPPRCAKRCSAPVRPSRCPRGPAPGGGATTTTCGWPSGPRCRPARRCGLSSRARSPVWTRNWPDPPDRRNEAATSRLLAS